MTNNKTSSLYVAGICSVVAIGGFLFGYDLVVVAGAKPLYEAFFNIGDRPWLQGWIVSCAYVGCLGGAILSGMSAERFGRKPLLIVGALLFMLSALGMALAPTVFMLIAFRIVCGVGVGMASALSPMYIAEVSPSHCRGRFVAFNQLAIVIGILAAQIINLFIAQFGAQLGPEGAVQEIAQSWNGLYGWRWMFAAVSVPSGLFFLLMFFVPESPRWLVKKGRTEPAKNILKTIGGNSYADGEMQEIVRSLATERENPSRWSDLFDVKILPILILAIFIAVYSQWTGVNVIFNYAEEIFKAAGFPLEGMWLTIVITGAINLLFTFVAIGTVDRWGRKVLFGIGSGGLAIILTTLGFCYFFNLSGLLILFFILAAIACFAMTIGPVTWVLLSELFPNRVRGPGMAVAVFSLWIGCTALTQTFPILNRSLGTSGIFWIYGAISTIAFFVALRYLPETKGKSLEQIEIELTGKVKQ